MKLTDIIKAQKAAATLKTTIPASHPKAYQIHQAPGRINEAWGDLIALERAKAVREFINGKEPDTLDAKDKAALSLADRSIRFREKALEEAAKLGEKLNAIGVDFALEKTVKEAGAVNPDLACKLAKQLGSITVDEHGKASIRKNDSPSGMDTAQPLDEFVKSMARNPDYTFLFNSGKAQQAANKNSQGGITHTGPNPFIKGEHFNVTAQGRIVRDKPALAKRLMAEAQAAGRPSHNENSNPWTKENWNLTRQGQIFKSDPAKAARLKVEAA